MRTLMCLACLALLACGGGDDQAKTTASVKDIPVLTHGTVIDLQPHIEAGKVTVFDFYADWCPPCKKLDRSLVDMKAVYGDKLAIYKLDIVQWGSELTEHHGIKDLPYLMIYDANQQKIAAGPSAQVLPKLIKELNK